MNNILVNRYSELNSCDVIKMRTKIEVDPLTHLETETIEGACLRLANAWKTTFLPTKSAVDIIRSLIEYAQAHASIYYPSPQSILTYAYGEHISAEPYMPVCLTGLAGTGKSHIQHALARLLCKEDETLKLDGHHAFPLTAFTRVAVSGQKSISQILRPLCRPEVAKGSTRIPESALPQECARWRYSIGACLFSVDELQFLAQSKEATTLITQVLQALAEIRTPWMFGANYSLCWKLRSRPPEATQRLLGRPATLLPDPPESDCWADLLETYERVAPEIFGYEIKERLFELWSYTAGIKREPVSLLTHSYRICRQRGAWKVNWTDVERAYNSIEYSTSRTDVALLISQSIQGGELRHDLQCPFIDENTSESLEKFKETLRRARSNKFISAAIDASMTASEREALNAVSITDRKKENTKKGKVVRLRKPNKPTAESLQEAGRRFKDME